MASSGIASYVGGFTTGVTALAGGANTAATCPIMSSGTNVVSVVGTTGDSVILPASMPQGATITVINTAAAGTIDVYPNTGGTINGGTATTGQRGIATMTGATFTQVGTDGLTWVVDNTIAAVS